MQPSLFLDTTHLPRLFIESSVVSSRNTSVKRPALRGQAVWIGFFNGTFARAALNHLVLRRPPVYSRRRYPACLQRRLEGTRIDPTAYVDGIGNELPAMQEVAEIL